MLLQRLSRIRHPALCPVRVRSFHDGAMVNGIHHTDRRS